MAAQKTVDAVLFWGCLAWFYRRTPTRLSEDIEVRICKNEPHPDEDTAIETLEIYVL